MTAHSQCEDYREASQSLLTPKGQRFVKSATKLVLGTVIAVGLAYGAHFVFKTEKMTFTRVKLWDKMHQELRPWKENQEQYAVLQAIGAAGMRDTSLYIYRDWTEPTTAGLKNQCRETIIFALSEKVGQGSYLKFVDTPPLFSGKDYSESDLTCKLVPAG